MKIDHRPLLNLSHPWRLEAKELYIHTTANTPHCWILKPSIKDWLDELSITKFLFWEKPGVLYTDFTTKNAFLPHGDARLALPYPKAPCLWFARKSDILLLKLTHGGIT